MIRNKKQNKGYTLAFLLIAIGVIAVLVLMGSNIVSNSLKTSVIRQGSTEALYAAESGVNDVINKLNTTWAIDFANAPSGTPLEEDPFQITIDEKTSYSVTKVSLSRIDSNYVQAEIQVTGNSSAHSYTAQKKLTVTVKQAITAGVGILQYTQTKH